MGLQLASGASAPQHPIALFDLPALELDEDRVTGLAIRFGSPAERDREGQYFDVRTNLYLDAYIPATRARTKSSSTR